MSAVSGSETERAVVAPGVRPPIAVPRRLLRMRSDAALAERFAAGDEAAFDVMYERHRPVVLAVCMGVLGAPADAEDATQETFSALAVALRTRPPAELRPWLIRVARNASIDTTRRRRHRLLTIDGEIPEVAARPASSGKAELAVVLDGIRELPEGQRMALLMRELGGHSYSEIADFLDTDEESVKGLIARARVGLRTYREATELSCASARTTIAAEPDGRRYDKTIRRHLRTCGSCRSYREALRDDAKALRAALPIQAGTVATGSLTSGMLTAAKGSLISYGLTQAATTCAASACAVGAIGGMVFVAPLHRLGLPPILPAVKKAAPPHKHHTVVKAAPVTHVALPTHMAVMVQPGSSVVSEQATRTHSQTPQLKPTRPVEHHRHIAPTVTRVKLPSLPSVHKTATASEPAPSSAAGTPVSAPPAPAPVVTSPTDSTPSSSSSGSGSSAPSGGSIPTKSASATRGAGYPTGDPGTRPTGDPGTRPTGDPAPQPTGDSTPQPTGDPGSRPTGDSGAQPTGDSGTRPAAGEHHGGPVHVIVAAAAPAAAQASASTASVTATTPVTAAPTGDTTTATTSTPVTTTPTTTTTYTGPVSGDSRTPTWGRAESGARHAVSWHGTPAKQAVSPTASTVAVSPVTSTSTTPVSYGSHGWSGATGAPQQYGRPQHWGRR